MIRAPVRHYLPIAVAAIAVFGLSALLVMVARPTPAGRTLTTVNAQAFLADQEVLFGDFVHAELDVRAPSAIKTTVAVNFKPYRIADLQVSHVHLSGGTLTRYRYTLSCLVTACRITSGVRPFIFAPAIVRNPLGPVSAAWPLLSVYTRISPTAALLGQPQPRSVQAHLAAPDRPESPILWLLAGVIALALAGLVWTWWPRRPAAVAATHDPLEEALSVARHLAGAASMLRLRAALEDAAGELEAAGKTTLAVRARALAWRREQPSKNEVEALSVEARR